MRAGTAATAEPTDTGRVQARAIRLLVAGDRPKDIALVTGLTVDQVLQLQAETPGAHPTRAVIAAPCEELRCGQPQEGAGRPRRGWVQVKPAAQQALWFCGWRCVASHVNAQRAGR